MGTVAECHDACNGASGGAIEVLKSAEPVSRQRQEVHSLFTVDEQGNPKGGYSAGQGFTIHWQNGVEDRNGAFLEEVVEAVIQRMEFFQNSKFACGENDRGLAHLRGFLTCMQERLSRRQQAGTESSYRGN